jgi:nitric oxide reductase activation protein
MFPTQPVQQGGRQIPGMPTPGRNGNPAEPDPMDPHRAERAEQQEKLRNNDRQKRLVADTEKLLALATDLKAQVDKSTKDTLSVDVIKKADEIEKLAHSVKERMKG